MLPRARLPKPVGVSVMPAFLAVGAGVEEAATGAVGFPGATGVRTGAVGVTSGAVGVTLGAVGVRAAAVGTLSGAVGTKTGAVATKGADVGTIFGAVGTVAGAEGTVAGAVGTVLGAVGTVSGAVGTTFPAAGASVGVPCCSCRVAPSAVAGLMTASDKTMDKTATATVDEKRIARDIKDCFDSKQRRKP